MSLNKTQFGLAFLIGFAAVAIIVGVSTLPHLEAIGMVLAPGLLIAALIFQQGIHSDHAMLYLVAAGLLDAVLFSLLALLVIRTRSKDAVRHR